MYREIKPSPTNCKTYKNQDTMLRALGKIRPEINFDYVVYTFPDKRITPIIRVHKDSEYAMISFARFGWFTI